MPSCSPSKLIKQKLYYRLGRKGECYLTWKENSKYFYDPSPIRERDAPLIKKMFPEYIPVRKP